MFALAPRGIAPDSTRRVRRTRVVPVTGLEGNFVALDARTGELLWHVNLGGPNASGPIGYTVDGKQYVVGTGQGSTFVFALPE